MKKKKLIAYFSIDVLTNAIDFVFDNKKYTFLQLKITIFPQYLK